jgi:O-methyltransferase domain
MSNVSPESQLWNLLRGALTGRALGIAADLRVARALASDGVFAEVESRLFCNTPASGLLQTGWGAFAHLFEGLFYGTVEALEADGEPSFPTVFGADFWSWLALHPDERASFDLAMEQGKERRAARLADIEWRGDETVVDVGGRIGSFLVELLRGRPGLRGVVFDLPETVRDQEALAAAGIEFEEGSFLERVPEGNVYVLGTVLHDWSDEQTVAILRTIREHAPANARLLIVDAVIPPGNDPHGSKWLDLLMLAVAGFEPTRIDDGLIEARCR